MNRFGKESQDENVELRLAQLEVLEKYSKGIFAVEVMCGEAITSLLGLKTGLFEQVTLLDNYEKVFELIRKNAKSIGIESKLELEVMDIAKDTPTGKYNNCLAISTQMFNPDYPYMADSLGQLYLPTETALFLKK